MLTRRHTILSAIAASAGLLGLSTAVPSSAADPLFSGIDRAMPGEDMTIISCYLNLRAEVRQGNGRIYPRTVVQEVVDQLNKREVIIHAAYKTYNDDPVASTVIGATVPGPNRLTRSGRVLVFVKVATNVPGYQAALAKQAWADHTMGKSVIGTACQGSVSEGSARGALSVVLPGLTLDYLALFPADQA